MIWCLGTIAIIHNKKIRCLKIFWSLIKNVGYAILYSTQLLSKYEINLCHSAPVYSRMYKLFEFHHSVPNILKVFNNYESVVQYIFLYNHSMPLYSIHVIVVYVSFLRLCSPATTVNWNCHKLSRFSMRCSPEFTAE